MKEQNNFMSIFNFFRRQEINARWMNFFSNVLREVSTLSTCYKTKVGCLLVRDSRIIAIGYNGTPKNWDHCEYDNSLHKTYEIHSEQNVVAFAAKNGINTNNAELWTEYSPCGECAKLIVAAGIKKVYYRTLYSNDTLGVEILKKSNISIIKIDE
jgi:dCMP deaminase